MLAILFVKNNCSIRVYSWKPPFPLSVLDSHVSFEQLKMIMQWGREDIAEEELKKTIKDKVRCFYAQKYTSSIFSFTSPIREDKFVLNTIANVNTN